MKNTIRVFGLISVALIIVFSACDDGSSGGGNSGGGGGGGGSSSGYTLTVTGIPSELEGKDLLAWAYRPWPKGYLYDGGGTVKNGEMRTNMYLDFKIYTGNETLDVYVEFWANTGNTEDNIGRGYKSVKFSNGSATVSWNQGLPTVNSWPVGWEW
jgi:hypothetical protein